MASRIHYIAIVVLGAAAALAVGAQTPIGAAIWPPAPEAPEPSGAQLAGFIAYGVYSALAFGAGAALTVALVRRSRHVRNDRGLAVASVIAIAWLTMSWVPHDNLHMMVGTDPAGLLALEWGFHGTLILAGIVVAMQLLRTWPAPAAAEPARSALRGEAA